MQLIIACCLVFHWLKIYNKTLIILYFIFFLKMFCSKPVNPKCYLDTTLFFIMMPESFSFCGQCFKLYNSEHCHTFDVVQVFGTVLQILRGERLHSPVSSTNGKTEAGAGRSCYLTHGCYSEQLSDGTRTFLHLS